jgi:hypothetical protein
MLGKAIEEDCFEKRRANMDATVVFNKPEFAKAVHEEADAGAGSANHLCQGLLSDGRYELCRFLWFTEIGHQEEESCESLLAGVK